MIPLFMGCSQTYHTQPIVLEKYTYVMQPRPSVSLTADYF